MREQQAPVLVNEYPDGSSQRKTLESVSKMGQTTQPAKSPAV
jgi:hypothetical protein